MKTILALLLCSAIELHASPVTVTSTPLSMIHTVGAAPYMHTVPPGTACYKIAYGTTLNGSIPVNYLMGLIDPNGVPDTHGHLPVVLMRYDTQSLSITANVFAATTYAEMAAECSTLGITNLPPQVTGQP